MKFLCKIGCHIYNKREIHIEGQLIKGKKSFPACIIEKCDCGAKRFAPWHGGIKPTSIMIPKRFMYKNEKSLK